jgi:hypothetical protein
LCLLDVGISWRARFGPAFIIRTDGDPLAIVARRRATPTIRTTRVDPMLAPRSE